MGISVIIIWLEEMAMSNQSDHGFQINLYGQLKP